MASSLLSLTLTPSGRRLVGDHLIDGAIRDTLASSRPARAPDPHACWSCGANAITRDPRQPHTVRCGICGAVRQILVELPSVAQRVAKERERHGGGPRVVP